LPKYKPRQITCIATVEKLSTQIASCMYFPAVSNGIVRKGMVFLERERERERQRGECRNRGNKLASEGAILLDLAMRRNCNELKMTHT